MGVRAGMVGVVGVWGWGGMLHAWESSATSREGGREGGRDRGVKNSSLLWFAGEAYNIDELLLQFTL